MPVDILNNQTLANTPTVGNQDVIPAMPIIPTPNGDPGVPVVPVIKRRKAKRTKAQKDSAKENASVMWNAIDKRREEYRGQINELAKEFNRSPEWMATQMYAGRKLLRSERKESLFNAFVFDRARTLREQGGMNGKNALPDLVKQCAEDGEWKELDTDEEEWLLQQLRDSKATKTTKTATHAAADIEGTLSRLNPEMTSLTQRTGSLLWYGVIRSKVTDNFAPRSFAPPEVRDACVTLFKHTPDEIVLKIDAFVTAGLPGVIKMSGSKRPVKIKAEIRERVLQGLREAVMKYRNCEPDDAPTSMSYSNYELLVHNHGIELIGWTEPEICNPGTIQTAISLNRLVSALRNGDCYWAVLTDEAWEAKKKARQDGCTGKKRKRRSDAGIPKRKKKKSNKQVRSAARVRDSDDSEEELEDEYGNGTDNDDEAQESA